MDSTTVFAICVGVAISACILAKGICYLGPLRTIVTVRFSKHLSYPYAVNRHRWIGPWTRLGVLSHVVYLTANVVCLLFPPAKMSEVGLRAARLSLINMSVLFLAPHLSLLADILGVSLRQCRKVHKSAAWVGFLLLAVHVLIAMHINGGVVSEQYAKDVFLIIVSPPGPRESYH